MYLKRVEISGFKSFASRSVLDFLYGNNPADGKPERMITAIVGPNGSGKSNVADAIRWAIGEQSLKNLRGKKSEDVIFSGSGTKARMGSASVSLLFDNADHRIPIDFSEVMITRKIYRSGESEYLINGSRVRLLDVVDILAKAGIGRDSYCVITQGMSDAVLSATPAERRSVFEDAAGVKPYQIEKLRAIRKLESTLENLTRVDALVVEIEPLLKNLKRQAERAAESKNIVEKLQAKQTALFGFLWANFQGERGNLRSQRVVLEEQIVVLERDGAWLQNEVGRLSLLMDDQKEEERLSGELSIARGRLNELSRGRSVVEGRIEIENEKRKEREVVRVIPVDLKFVQAALDRIRTHQEELIRRVQVIEKLEDLQDVREFAQVIQQELFDLHRQAGDGAVKEKQIIALPEEERKASDVRLKQLEVERQHLETGENELLERIRMGEEAVRTVREASRSSREQFFVMEKESRDKERGLSQLKDNLNELKVRLARVEVREEDLVVLVREELHMKPEDVPYNGETCDREKMEREIARLKVEAEHSGSIDPLVVDEYEETKVRYETLSRESADLKQAIGSLEEVIREMDRKIDVAFKDAFRAIEKKFEHYFRIIFGGGKAELRLVKIPLRRGAIEFEAEAELSEDEMPIHEEDQGEQSGIEIDVCPPGKKINNLSMLSGGERSLTSLALLFAIISHNPPPFAVLDEVEAALDEANSRRFSELLRELSARTQFVAITHNRQTMAQAGLLYGVTMGEDGVSKLLSIRLDEVGEDGKIGKKK